MAELSIFWRKATTFKISSLYSTFGLYLFFFKLGESMNAVLQKLCHRVSHIWGNHRGQHIWNSIDNWLMSLKELVLLIKDK